MEGFRRCSVRVREGLDKGLRGKRKVSEEEKEGRVGVKKGSKRGFLAPFWGFWGVPLKRPKKGLFEPFGDFWRSYGGIPKVFWEDPIGA